MKRTQKTKHALVASVVSMAMCSALLLGTTFAWFTDSVTNTGNKIEAGTLSIQLNDQDSGGEKLFSSDDFLWEPGRSKTAKVKLANTGSLWLKYTISFSDVQVTPNPQYPDADITDVLDVYKVPKTEGVAATDLDDNTRLGTVKQLMTAGTLETTEGILAPSGETGTVADQQIDSEDAFTLVIKMQESAGNKYQGATATFDVVVNATQYTYEEDGFNSNQYDADAGYPVSESVGTAEELKNLANKPGVPVELTVPETVTNVGTLNVTGDVTLNLGDSMLQSRNSAISGATLAAQDGGSLTINATPPTGSGMDYTAAGIKATGEGSQVNVNGGRYGVSGMGGAEILAEQGGTVTVQDGIFSTSGMGGSAVKATAGSTVYVKGGKYSASGYQSVLMLADGGTIVVDTCTIGSVNGRSYGAANGGRVLVSKSFSPSKPTSIASGCTVTEEGDYWVISEG